MDTQRPTDRVAEFIRSQLILARKDFDPLRQASATFHRYTQSPGQVVNVNSAVSGEQRLVGENPQMTAAAGLLQSRLNSILAKFPLEFQKILQSAFVVSIDRDPLGALGLGVDGIKGDRELAVEVLLNRLK